MKSLVKIVYHGTDEILYSCEVSEIETAYKKLEEYEQMGLEVDFFVPGTAQTLADQLHMTEDDRAKFMQSLQEEIDSHEDDSCCYSSKKAQ